MDIWPKYITELRAWIYFYNIKKYGRQNERDILIGISEAKKKVKVKLSKGYIQHVLTKTFKKIMVVSSKQK